MIPLTLLADEGNLVRVRVDGPLSPTRYATVGNPLEDLLGPAGFARPVLLDLGPIDYLDSGGISWLLVNHKRCRQAGGVLVLYGLAPRVRQVLDCCRLESILHLAADEAAARAVARGAGPG